MKQFFPEGRGYKEIMPYDIVMRLMPAKDRVVLRVMDVGRSFIDSYGVVWTRLPDAPDTTADRCLDALIDHDASKAERLERIATAALQGLLAAPTAREWSGTVHALNAVGIAKDLIAELDAAK